MYLLSQIKSMFSTRKAKPQKKIKKSFSKTVKKTKKRSTKSESANAKELRILKNTLATTMVPGVGKKGKYKKQLISVKSALNTNK